MSETPKEQYYYGINEGADGPVDEEVNEEMQQMLRSMEVPESELSPEEMEEFEKLKRGARNVIKCFQLKRSEDNKKGETLRIVADAGVDSLMLRALYEEGRAAAGNDCRLVVVPKTERPATPLGEAVGQQIQMTDAVLLFTSLSRSHAQETGAVINPRHDMELIERILNSSHQQGNFPILSNYKLEEIEEKIKALPREIYLKKTGEEPGGYPTRARLISVTSSRREILSEGGALEDPNIMSERIDKFAEAVKGLEKVRITSDNGTDLILDIKTSSLEDEKGIVDKPGTFSNFPSGEYCSAVDLEGTNGVYVCDGCLTVLNRLPEGEPPIRLTIEKGRIVKIEGGEYAVKLQELLNDVEAKQKEAHPDDDINSAFRLAEFAFGMNSKAFRIGSDGQRIAAPVLLEAEKCLGTVHIATGRNASFKGMSPKDPDFNDVNIHIDFVAMNPNVTGFREDNSEFEIIKDGEIVCI